MAGKRGDVYFPLDMPTRVTAEYITQAAESTVGRLDVKNKIKYL
jgi:hypothetical protein